MIKKIGEKKINPNKAKMKSKNLLNFKYNIMFVLSVDQLSKKLMIFSEG